MDTISLKEYIFENEKIEFVLEKIGCHHIKFHPNKDFWSCGNFNGDNINAINVKNNKYLNVVNWTREKDFDDTSDIITLVQYNKNCSFIEAIKYLHGILDLEYKWERTHKKTKEKNDPLYIFKKWDNKQRLVDVNDINILDEDLLNDYIPLLHISWLREGVMERTRRKFGIAYSYKQKRIIIPYRYWLTGELVGTNMRTTIDNYNELGIKKYFITPTYQKHLNLYGLYENYNSIQKAGYVVIYESEKSVLKRDSLCDSTGVALSGHSLSNEQVRILIGLNVDIIISMDNDIPIEEVRYMASKFYNIRNVYYTYDKWDLLGEKDSIADMPNKIFDFFMKHKVKYDDVEHQKYLKSIKR